MAVSVDGLAEVLANLGKVSQRVYDRAYTAIDDATIGCLQDAQAWCPVDTGALEKSGTREVQELPLANGGMEIQGTVSFGDDQVDYALPVELGHHTRSGSFVAPQAFLYPAFVMASIDLKAELRSIVG